MKARIVACAGIVLLAIVVVGATWIYQPWGESAAKRTEDEPKVGVSTKLVSIVARRDNSIFSESNNSGGAASTLFSGRNNRGSPRRALLRYDVAGAIPAGSRVHRAALILHSSGAAQSETMAREFSLHRVLSDWGEGSSGKGGPGGGRGAKPTPKDATWKHAACFSSSVPA